MMIRNVRVSVDYEIMELIMRYSVISKLGTQRSKLEKNTVSGNFDQLVFGACFVYEMSCYLHGVLHLEYNYSSRTIKYVMDFDNILHI